MSLRVLAIDPGERVGYATGRIVPRGERYPIRPVGGRRGYVAETDTLPPPRSIEVGEGPALTVDTHGISELKTFALSYLDVVGDYDVVVYETWRLRPAMAKTFIGSDFPTVQLIGVIRAGAWKAGVKLVGQGPDTKATANKLLKAGKHPDIAARIAAAPATHDEAHDTDALRHLLFHFFKEHM